MKLKILVVFALLLVLTTIATVSLHADWTSIPFGRITVQGWYTPNDNFMYVIGVAYINAEERLSLAMDDYCSQFPDKCAALGIVVKSKQ